MPDENKDENTEEKVDKKKPVKKKKKQVPLEEQMLNLEGYLSTNSQANGENNPYGAAFKVWFVNDRKKQKEEIKDAKEKAAFKLFPRMKLAEWQKLYDKCMKQEVKNK